MYVQSVGYGREICLCFRLGMVWTMHALHECHVCFGYQRLGDMQLPGRGLQYMCTAI